MKEGWKRLLHENAADVEYLCITILPILVKFCPILHPVTQTYAVYGIYLDPSVRYGFGTQQIRAYGSHRLLDKQFHLDVTKKWFNPNLESCKLCLSWGLIPYRAIYVYIGFAVYHSKIFIALTNVWKQIWQSISLFLLWLLNQFLTLSRKD